LSLPRPEAGLVVRYSYLWHAEQAQGREEGAKDRPCAIILAVLDRKAGRDRVWLLPVTHLVPIDHEAAVEIPAAVKRRLGLDDERSWVVLSEWNECLWPSPDLRRTSRRKDASVAYGFLPPKFFDHLRRRFVNLVEKRKARRVARTD
jgi:hypothetical protein